MEKTANVVIDGAKYELYLSNAATKELSARYDGLENIDKKMLSTDNVSDAISEVVWLITLLANEAIKKYNVKNEAKKPFLTEEEVSLLTVPREMPEYKDAIVEALLIGLDRTVQSEDDSKNVQVE